MNLLHATVFVFLYIIITFIIYLLTCGNEQYKKILEKNENCNNYPKLSRAHRGYQCWDWNNYTN